MSYNDFEVLVQADNWLASGQKVALLVIAKTFGSSPRPTGSLQPVLELYVDANRLSDTWTWNQVKLVFIP